MLPDVNIDNEAYGEILEEAKNIIVSMYPEWTDFNEHDPGVTMLELFAAMKESQQFFANQIGEGNRQKYLKLLGVYRRTKKPAHSFVKIRADGNYRLLQSHKTDADGVCFETVGAKQLIQDDLQLCMAVCGGQMQDMFYREQMAFLGELYFAPFGKHPACGDSVYLGFEKALPDKVLLDLYAVVYKGYEVKRNPLQGGGFGELVTLQWQYYTQGGWKNIETVHDGTHGFIFDGFIRFSIDGKMERICVMQQTGYFIRAVLKEGAYDVPPVLTGISMNICEVVQRDTLSECIRKEAPWEELGFELDTELSVLGKSEVLLGRDGLYRPVKAFAKEICRERGSARFSIEDEGMENADSVLIINSDLSFLHKRKAGVLSGFPNQELDLEELQLEYESFVLLIEDSVQKGAYRLWDKVYDFSGSTPKDRHYIIDTRRGKLLFGDCIHGMAPEGEAVIAGFATTRGRDGNVTAGAIKGFRMESLREIGLWNICGGVGGQDEETLEESFLRAKKSIGEYGCAVTGADYEKYVRQTPGLMIESCSLIRSSDIQKFTKKTDETAVHLVVKPYGDGSMAKRSYCQNISSYLENYRMLGSQVSIFFPEYVEVGIYVEAVVKPQYPDIEKRLGRAVAGFFDAYKNIFGGTIFYSKLYGFLDRQDFVQELRSLNMETKGSGVKRSRDGDLQLSPYGIAVLGEVKTFLM